MKTFYCLCDGGLGNRINALVSGMLIWTQHFDHTEFIVLWPKNRYCQARIDEIFDLEILGRYFPTGLKFKHKIPKNLENDTVHILAHHKKNFNGNFSNIMSVKYKQKLNETFETSERTIIFSTPLLPYFLKLREVERLQRFITPSSIVRSRIELRKQFTQKNAIGLHLRGTDYGFSNSYFTFWRIIVKVLFFVKFQLFTDDKVVEDRFGRLKNIHSIKISTLPERYNNSLDWKQMFGDHYNVKRDALSVIDAFADLLTLSALPKIPTSRSTYLYNAFYLSKRKSRFAFFLLFFVNRIISFSRALRGKK